jgi:hypothetical protein
MLKKISCEIFFHDYESEQLDEVTDDLRQRGIRYRVIKSGKVSIVIHDPINEVDDRDLTRLEWYTKLKSKQKT